MNTDAIERLVRRGAAITMRTDTTPVAVAWWREAGPGIHFWFEPGDTHNDGHRFTCTSVEVFYGGDAVAFRDGAGELVAYLSPIEDQVDDSETAHRMADSVAAWKSRFANDENLRAFVFNETHSATA